MQCSVGVAAAAGTGSTGVKPPGLLSCGWMVLLRWRTCLGKCIIQGLMEPGAGPLNSSGAAQDAEAEVVPVGLHWQWEGELQLQAPLAPQAIRGEDVLLLQVWICTPCQWYCNKNDPGNEGFLLKRAKAQQEVASSGNSPAPHSSTAALEDCRDRWSPKSWTKGTEWMF